MAAETLYLLHESIIEASFWNCQTINAVRRQAAYKRLPLKEISLEDLSGGKLSEGLVLMLIGGTIKWHNTVLDLCVRQGIRPLLLPGTNAVTTRKASMIVLDKELMCESVLRYALSAGRKRVAFFANNPRSTTDHAKVNGLKQSAAALGVPFSDEDVFDNSGNLKKCLEDFAAHVLRYDAVICANDAAAAAMMNDRDFRRCVQIPRDLYVITLGNSCLARLTDPSLTGVGLDFQQVGTLAVDHALYLIRHPEVDAFITLLKPTFFLGGSTEYHAFDHAPVSVFQTDAPVKKADTSDRSFYADELVKEFQLIEIELNSADRLEKRILAAIMRGEPKAKTIDECFISESTYKYRVRNIREALQKDSRADIRDMLARWIDPEALSEWAGKGPVTGA